MTRQTIIMTMAMIVAVMFALSGSASACCKAKFVRTKPHVNVSTFAHADRSSRSGQTVVIGGLHHGWGQAPTAQNQELMILVTPKIVTPPK